MLEDHLDQLFDIFTDAVCVTDAKGIVLYLNNSYEAISGIDRELLIGKQIRDFSGTKSFFDIILNPDVIRTGQIITRIQKRDDGRQLVLEGHPIFNDQGHAEFCVTLIRDASSLAELQKKTELTKRIARCIL